MIGGEKWLSSYFIYFISSDRRSLDYFVLSANILCFSGYSDRGGEEWRDLLISSGAAIALVTFTRPGANKR